MRRASGCALSGKRTRRSSDGSWKPARSDCRSAARAPYILQSAQPSATRDSQGSNLRAQETLPSETLERCEDPRRLVREDGALAEMLATVFDKTVGLPSVRASEAR